MADKLGAYTSNNYFYKPSLDSPYDTHEGNYERTLFEGSLDSTDLFLNSVASTITGINNSLSSIATSITNINLSLSPIVTHIAINTTSDSVLIGTATSYTEIESDGTIKYVGGARVWRDEKVRVGTAKLHPTATPSWANYQGGMVLTFDGAADNTIYFEAQLNHDYAIGENIEFHIHYVPEDATAGNHRWKLGYTWASIGTTFASQATIAAIIAAPEVANKHSIAAISSTITGTNKGISSILICELTRTASHTSDTYNNKHIKLISADFHYPCDTTGSRERLSK